MPDRIAMYADMGAKLNEDFLSPLGFLDALRARGFTEKEARAFAEIAYFAYGTTEREWDLEAWLATKRGGRKEEEKVAAPITVSAHVTWGTLEYDICVKMGSVAELMEQMSVLLPGCRDALKSVVS